MARICACGLKHAGGEKGMVMKRKMAGKNQKCLEVCCGSYEDAEAAFRGGADRIELNSALFMGGLTADMGALLLAKETVGIPIICMVRPRGAGFCYSREQYLEMKKDAELLLAAGADGLAFGFLDADSRIEQERTKEFVEKIHAAGKTAVFHRAFDCVSEQEKALDLLIALGVDRVLTSGGQKTAMEGRNTLARLQKNYGAQIEILAGSGICADNARQFMEQTGINQIHSSCKGWVTDKTTIGNKVSYSYASGKQELAYEVVSENVVQELHALIL